jgi:DNA modification methylase
MGELADGSVDLVVTSPPYPMIEMWDGLFSELSPKAAQALAKGLGPLAFEYMHRELDPVWQEVFRVLRDGGIACIDIGDAVRTIAGRFALYPNHSRIMTYMLGIGFSALPAILWRKQTNAPNKFMGSGMMPPGAYVTLEHEYVLILRKGDKRDFPTESEKQRRRESAFFWEERNQWFSDVWMDLKGASQSLLDGEARERSAAFPFELPYRLISMFSVKQDLVLDPFLGAGTTMYAAMAAGRDSVGYEVAPALDASIFSKLEGFPDYANARIGDRLEKHRLFVEERFREKGKFKYINEPHGFPVMTNQETALFLNELETVRRTAEGPLEAVHADQPGPPADRDWTGHVLSPAEKQKTKKLGRPRKVKEPEQLTLLGEDD